mmetsp:Transcript_15625/g.24250  ORF Transcript_15625/g.24250 Transcript_15625/m.24250 type:complete len:421 (+) Transcript_15625:87-1349(+)
MDRLTDPAFFTDEEIANFAEHLSEQGLSIYISSSSISSVHVHPDLKDLVSEQLDLKDATSASIVPMASALAEVREEETSRELEKCVSLPYVHDENRYQQMMMNSDGDDNDRVVRTTEETPAFTERSNSDDANDRDGMSASNQDTEELVDSITNSEQNHDDISNEVQEVHKTSPGCSSIDGNEGNTSEVEESEIRSEALQQSSSTPMENSSFSNINAGIVSQREKIRDICNNRQKSGKKKERVRRGNYFKEECGDELSESEEEQSHEKQAASSTPRQEADEKSESGATEGFLGTEDEQSDDLIEFETQTTVPITRKRKSNSLLATSEAIGSNIAKEAATDGGGDSEWIDRATKRRSKLKKSAKRVSLDNPSSNKPSAKKQNSTATQHRNRGGRRSVGFGAAPKAVNKRKTQLSLLHMFKKK